MGRPSIYKESFGEKLIALMATGLSMTASAAELGFHRDRLYEWEKQYPEFAECLALARGKRVLHLEKRLLSAKEGPIVTSTIFALKNADNVEWREKQEITGKDGAPLVPDSDDRTVARAILSLLRTGANAGDGG